MMSLVAYGSSGESENESDTEGASVSEKGNKSVSSLPSGDLNDKSKDTSSTTSFNTTTITSALPIPPTNGHEAKLGLQSKLPPPKMSVIEDEEEDLDSLSLSSKLPAPKHHSTSSLLGTSLVQPQEKKTRGKKGTVKITIPSLSDFPEDEDEPKARKKIQPSAKGSGLFALLPPPKTAPVKEANRSLVPNVLTRKPIPAPPLRKVPSKPTAATKRKQPDSDPESDGEGESIDFFSLNKEDKLPELPQTEVDLLATASGYPTPSSSAAYVDPASSLQPDTYSEYQYQEYNQETQGTALAPADSGEDFIGFSGGQDLQLDDEALKKLCGRKGRNREEIQIVDVSGDAIMPDQREWLTKQLTEEQPRSSGSGKLHGISSQQKRKHQITYLAHIAKANELELKNQWASNRQTRKQTQSKYGF